MTESGILVLAPQYIPGLRVSDQRQPDIDVVRVLSTSSVSRVTRALGRMGKRRVGGRLKLA